VKNRILVTGAGGFVGGHLLSYLKKAGYDAIAGKRVVTKDDKKSIQLDLTRSPVMDRKKLEGVDVVIHCAGIAEVNESDRGNVEHCEVVNVFGAVNLATLSAEEGVKRFIFISSLKVYGESTKEGEVFRIDSDQKPQGAYALSKATAENMLRDLARESGMEVVILRPPLIYGAGVGGNFQRLVGVVNRAGVLPLGAIHNKRSMVYIGNLCSLIERITFSPVAADRTFLVSDGDDLSTTELLQVLKEVSGSSLYLIPIPEQMLRLAFRVLGKQNIGEKLLGSLCADISETVELLDWEPPFTVNDAIKATVSAK